MAKQQTAVAFLQHALYVHFDHEQVRQFEGLFQQALAMEREQIVLFAYEQIQQIECEIEDLTFKEVPEEIYRRIYGNK